MAFIDNDISNHPLLRALEDGGLLNDDGTMFVQRRTPRAGSGERNARRQLELMDQQKAARALQRGEFPAGGGEPISEVTVDLGQRDNISVKDAMRQSEAARLRLGRMEQEDGPFLRVLKRWGITPESSYGEASGGVWDALSAMNRGEPGSEITNEDLGDIRRYLIAKRMVQPGWASDRPPGGDVGVTTRLPGMGRGSGYRTQDARQQAEWDMMQKLIGKWDPRTNQPIGWGAGKGPFGETFNPRLHQTDPTGKSGVMDKFLELMGPSAPQYENPADVGTPHLVPDGKGGWNFQPGGQGQGFWP